MILQYLMCDKTCNQSKTFWTFFHVYLCIRYRYTEALQEIKYDDILKDSRIRTIRRLKQVVGNTVFGLEYEIFNKSCVENLFRLEHLPFHTKKVYLFEFEKIYAANLTSEQFKTLMIHLWQIQKRWLMNQV